MNTYVLYLSDAWNRNPDFIGVFTSDEELLNGVRKFVLKNVKDYQSYDYEETPDETAERIVDEFCKCRLQTQGYSTNLQAGKIELNELYD